MDVTFGRKLNNMYNFSRDKSQIPAVVFISAEVILEKDNVVVGTPL